MPYTSTIANKLLVTPFDDKCVIPQEISESLTPEEFCKHCYSKPQFEKEFTQCTGEELRDDSNDITTNLYELSNQRHQQKMAFENFNLWLNNFEADKVYTINGNAGTGKTTFINYMKYNEKNVKWLILDIHLARSFDAWFADIRTDVDHFEKAQSKVYACIMNIIWELLFQGLDEDENYSLSVVYNNLRKLTDNFKKRLASVYPPGYTLLVELCRFFNDNGNMEEIVQNSAGEFKKHIDGKTGSNGEGIISALDILLLVLSCLSDDPNEKYIILFDNFERFIAKDELYNKDVDIIRRLLSSYINGINQKGKPYRKHFKFVMAVRDSTARMCGVRLQASDSEPNNLDIGKWYDTQNIIALKKKWYVDNKMAIEGTDLVEQIIGDSRVCMDQTITGLQLFIGPLFNDNKRLIIDFIGSMVELPKNASNIAVYQKLWEEDSPLSRFAARSVIRGMILNELEEKPDKLFEHLKTYSTLHDNNGIGDARKILTILFNHIGEYNNDDMPLTEILKQLFGRLDIETAWNKKEYIQKKESISEILFYMNSYNRRENDWIQFIDIQFKGENQETRDDIIVENPTKLLEILSENMKNCTIHLMPAGRAYLQYIVASFDFFSLRYIKNYTPLFTLVPTPEMMENCLDVKTLPCYKKIEGVIKYAGKCIEALVKEDTIGINIGDSQKGTTHKQRIINHHRSYINSFIKYIKDK